MSFPDYTRHDNDVAIRSSHFFGEIAFAVTRNEASKTNIVTLLELPFFLLLTVKY
jgi:hypothetical protein